MYSILLSTWNKLKIKIKKKKNLTNINAFNNIYRNIEIYMLFIRYFLKAFDRNNGYDFYEISITISISINKYYDIIYT